MIRSEKVMRVEAQYGEALETLLPRLFQEAGGHQTRLAQTLGIHRTLLVYWFQRCHLSVVKRLVTEEERRRI